MSANPIEMRRFRRAEVANALTDEPAKLAAFHKAAGDLLSMMATRVEPSWDLAEAALGEIDRLLALQGAIICELAGRAAQGPDEVIAKLSLWALAHGDADPRDAQPEDQLVLSALEDLRRLFSKV